MPGNLFTTLLKFLPMWMVRYLVDYGIIRDSPVFKEHLNRDAYSIAKELTDDPELLEMFVHDCAVLGTLPEKLWFPMLTYMRVYHHGGSWYPKNNPSEV